jgi:hypothetical protein
LHISRLNRTFAAGNDSDIIVMTTVELRTSIVEELNQMSDEMLQSVSHYVKRLRRHARPVSKVADKDNVPDIVLSLLGAGVPVAEDDLDARAAYNEYLKEKYQ